MNATTQATQGPGSPAVERAAVRVAERVAAAWHSVDHSGRLDVPICVVAAIALASTTGPDGQDVTESLTAWIRGDIAGFARTVWTRTLIHRPDLATPLHPLLAWLYPQRDPAARAADDQAVDDGGVDDAVPAQRGASEQGRDPEAWRGEIDASLLAGAQKVADAALRAGQLALSGTGRRRETDLLGITLTGLRPRSAVRAHGQYYTPAAAT